MPLSGQYKAENNDDHLSHFSIIMDVKETEKSYIFTLLELNSRYSASHMKLLFKNSARVVLRKNRAGHCVKVWGDDDFTFYPYQAGVPYYFERLRPAGS